MTPEQVQESLLKLFRKFKEQGVEVLYGVHFNGHYFLGFRPVERVKGSSELPQNREIRTEDDIKAWVS